MSTPQRSIGRVLQRFFANADGPTAITAANRLVVDGAIELASPAGGESSWPPGDVRVAVSHRFVRLPAEFHDIAEPWQNQHRDERSDPKVSLAALRSARRTLDVVVEETTWAEVQPFHSTARALPASRIRAHLNRWLLSAATSLPNIVGIHGIIRTSDEKIALARRSQLVRYHPSSWSVSFEEQLDSADLNAGDSAFHVAAARGVNEEFLIRGDALPSRVKLLAVLLEYEIVNPAVVAYVSLPLAAADLDSQWRSRHHDGEIASLEFVPLELGALAELVTGAPVTGRWHPTSRYRLLRLMIHEFGLSRTIEALEREQVRPG